MERDLFLLQCWRNSSTACCQGGVAGEEREKVVFGANIFENQKNP
jgi:hypothetical protein